MLAMPGLEQSVGSPATLHQLARRIHNPHGRSVAIAAAISAQPRIRHVSRIPSVRGE